MISGDKKRYLVITEDFRVGNSRKSPDRAHFRGENSATDRISGTKTPNKRYFRPEFCYNGKI